MKASKADLEAAVNKIFKDVWEKRDGRVLPEPKDLALGNDTVYFDCATVLYADLSGSTNLVDTEDWMFAAEVYKAYLLCAAKIIQNEGGTITAYDGDRVMGIFLGDLQRTSAARTGLKINYAIQKIVNPSLLRHYPSRKYEVKQVVGIDTSDLHAARTGVRGENDIVWVGRAANYAAKLTTLNNGVSTWITKESYMRLHNTIKYTGKDNTCMWKPYTWNSMNNHEIYGSTWIYPI